MICSLIVDHVTSEDVKGDLGPLSLPYTFGFSALYLEGTSVLIEPWRKNNVFLSAFERSDMVKDRGRYC